SYKMTAELNLVILVVSLSIVTFLWIFGAPIIRLLYGEQYHEAYTLLVILAMATTCGGLGTVAARLIIKEGNYSYISRKMLCVAISALPISYTMICMWGLKGAAYSVLLIEFLSLTFFNYFYKGGLIFKIHFFPIFKHTLNLKH